MNIIKKALLGMILLLVIALVWVGGSIYYQGNSTDINPNAQSYIKPLKTSFEIDELEKISTRTEECFPVAPSELLVLTRTN